MAPADRAGPCLRTARLMLRPWRDADLVPFRAINADPRVMAHFPRPLDAIESDALVARIRGHFAEHGFGLWAVEAPGVAALVGFVGLAVPGFAAPFTPCIEVGWRLAAEHWGHGYAREAAEAALAYGFHRVGLEEIVSFTVPANWRSIRVMEALGMRRAPADDFDHPSLTPGHPLRRHLLFRLSRDDWGRRRAGRGDAVAAA